MPDTAPMHIVHFVDYYHPKVGYQEPLLARTHARMGHRVTVITADRHFPYPNYDRVYRDLLGPRVVGPGEESIDGIRVIRLRALLDCAGFVLLPGLARALRRENPDLVIHHGLLHPNFFLTAVASRRGRWRLVADSHMAHYNTNPRAPGPRAFLWLYRAVLARFVRRHVRAVAIGPCERSFLEKVLPGLPVEVIPLGADGARFRMDMGERSQVRASLGIGADDLVLFHSGKFQPEKKTLEVVQAFGTLARGNPRLRLLLVGGGAGEYQSLIDAACAELPGLIRLAMVPNEQLPGLIMSADIGVWPGAPSITFIEAMAVGLPLVLERGEYGAYLLRAGNGLQVSSQDELVAALRNLVNDPVRLRAFGEGSRDLFNREFSADQVAARFLEPPAASFSLPRADAAARPGSPGF